MAKKIRPGWDDLTEEQQTRVTELRERLGLMTVNDVAMLSGVTESTVLDWIARGNGPPSIKLGSERYFTYAAVMDYLNDLNEETATKQRRKTRSDSDYRKQIAMGR